MQSSLIWSPKMIRDQEGTLLARQRKSCAHRTDICLPSMLTCSVSFALVLFLQWPSSLVILALLLHVLATS